VKSCPRILESCHGTCPRTLPIVIKHNAVSTNAVHGETWLSPIIMQFAHIHDPLHVSPWGPQRGRLSCNRLLRPPYRSVKRLCNHSLRTLQAAPRYSRLNAEPPALSSHATTDDSTQDDGEEEDGPPELFRPVPFTPAIGRKRQLALLFFGTILEFSLTGRE
jgi:hypothetical protein